VTRLQPAIESSKAAQHSLHTRTRPPLNRTHLKARCMGSSLGSSQGQNWWWWWCGICWWCVCKALIQTAAAHSIFDHQPRPPSTSTHPVPLIINQPDPPPHTRTPNPQSDARPPPIRHARTLVAEPKGSPPSPLKVCQYATLNRNQSFIFLPRMVSSAS